MFGCGCRLCRNLAGARRNDRAGSAALERAQQRVDFALRPDTQVAGAARTWGSGDNIVTRPQTVDAIDAAIVGDILARGLVGGFGRAKDGDRERRDRSAGRVADDPGKHRTFPQRDAHVLHARRLADGDGRARIPRVRSAKRRCEVCLALRGDDESSRRQRLEREAAGTVCDRAAAHSERRRRDRHNRAAHRLRRTLGGDDDARQDRGARRRNASPVARLLRSGGENREHERNENHRHRTRPI